MILADGNEKIVCLLFCLVNIRVVYGLWCSVCGACVIGEVNVLSQLRHIDAAAATPKTRVEHE